MTVIDDFRESDYRFLGNFYECDIEMDGMVYPSLEHAFQASKTFNQLDRAAIRDATSARAAKRAGRTVTLKHDWDNVRVDVMRQLLEKKFQVKELRRKLLATKNAELISGGDAFWGKKDGSGQNHLGNMLTEIRNSLFQVSLDNLDAVCRDFLSDCGWKRDYDGDSIHGECWVPPWEPDCQYDLSSAVEEQRMVTSKPIVVVDDDKDDIFSDAVAGLDAPTWTDTIGSTQ